MLKKQFRLRNNKDYQKVFKNSRPTYTENLIFRIAKGRGASRFGFVVSNKIEKRATRRNSLRRRLRSIVQDLMSEVASGYDVAILVKKDFAFPYKFEDIKGQVVEGLKKAGAIMPKS